MFSSPWNFKLCQYSGTSSGGRCLIVWCWHSWEPGKECITELVVAVMVDKHETEIRSCLFISTSMTSGMSSTRFMGCWRTRGSVHKWCYQFTCIQYILCTIYGTNDRSSRNHLNPWYKYWNNVNKKVTENLFRLLLLLNPMTLFKNSPWTGVSDSNISIVSHSTDQQIQNQSNEMNRDFNWHLWHFQQQKTLKHVKMKWC